MPVEDRYRQERALFGFFANAMSTVGSCCLGVYHIGRMTYPSAFTANERSVTVESTENAIAAVFPRETLAAELARARHSLGRDEGQPQHPASPRILGRHNPPEHRGGNAAAR